MTPLFRALRRLSVRLLIHSLAPRLRVTGIKHLPRRGPYILAPNHLSHFDSALLFGLVRKPVAFMSMRQIFEIPVIGHLARWFGAFPIEHQKADHAALSVARQRLENGEVLVVYPEGQLSADGELGDFSSGAVWLARQTGVPLIPIGISGTPHVMPYGLTWPRLALTPIGLHVGQPLDLADLNNLSARCFRKVATRRLEDAIRRAIAASAGRTA